MSDKEYKNLLLDDNWSKEADAICSEVSAALAPIINKYHDAGYNSYDIQLIIMEQVSIQVTGARLMRRHGHRRGKTWTKSPVDKA